MPSPALPPTGYAAAATGGSNGNWSSAKSKLTVPDRPCDRCIKVFPNAKDRMHFRRLCPTNAGHQANTLKKEHPKRSQEDINKRWASIKAKHPHAVRCPKHPQGGHSADRCHTDSPTNGVVRAVAPACGNAGGPPPAPSQTGMPHPGSDTCPPSEHSMGFACAAKSRPKTPVATSNCFSILGEAQSDTKVATGISDILYLKNPKRFIIDVAHALDAPLNAKRPKAVQPEPAHPEIMLSDDGMGVPGGIGYGNRHIRKDSSDELDYEADEMEYEFRDVPSDNTKLSP
ncbi:unnamed protein product, partial [Phaeothamnion confervicola]